MALTEALLNGAIGATKTIANVGLPAALPLLGLQAALTAIQVGAIASRQPPKYFKGTDWLERGNNPKGIDTIPILAHEGERIVPTAINEQLKGVKNNELVQLVNLGKLVRNGGVQVAKQGTNVVVNMDNEDVVNALDKMPKNLFTFDENGFSAYLLEKNRRTQFLNKRYGGA
jgi:hypothetical protein